MFAEHKQLAEKVEAVSKRLLSNGFSVNAAVEYFVTAFPKRRPPVSHYTQYALVSNRVP